MNNDNNDIDKVVTVFGGSGFIGRYVVQALVNDGWKIIIACRHPDRAQPLLSLGAEEQIQAIQADLHDPRSIKNALKGSSAAVNMVGILTETNDQKFTDIQAKGAQSVADAVADASIVRFVHFSAIGANARGASAYARTKSAGETGVLATIPSAVVVRPSVVFGPGDNFLNRFATMARYFPILPIVGAETKFQPVYAGDVAGAVAAGLSGQATPGTIYELGGPEVKTFGAIIEFVMKTTGHTRYMIKLDFEAGKGMAFVTQLLTMVSFGLFPEMLRMTIDQVELLKHDNIVSQNAISEGRTLQSLGISPRSIEMIAPSYLR